MQAKNTATSLLSLALTLGLSTTALCQNQAKGQKPARKAQAAPLLDLFQDLDVNGDRVIEKQEVPESAVKAFETLLKNGDADHNGKLEAAEYRTLLQRMDRGGGVPRELRERRFKSLDKNSDGKLDLEEFPGVSTRFKSLDKNGDGFLSLDEMSSPGERAPASKAAQEPAPAPARAKANAAGRPAMKRLQAMDKDGDNRISREEFTGRPAVFDRLDTNHDGYLDRADRGQAARAKAKAAGKKEKAKPEF